jgi:hypothetical protein
MYVYGRIYLGYVIKIKSSFLRRILEHGDVEGALRQGQVYVCACAIFLLLLFLKRQYHENLVSVLIAVDQN